VKWRRNLGGGGGGGGGGVGGGGGRGEEVNSGHCKEEGEGSG
jgi:hypothetical protein